MWKTVTLGVSCKMYQPKTISAKEMVADGEYLVYGANGAIGRYHNYNHAEPQLLVTCRGATCGAVNVSKPFSWINGNAMVIQPDLSEISLKYMEYLFRGGIDLSKAITGAAQPQITRKSLEPILCSYPPLAEQQRIVAKLDAAFAEIDEAVEVTKNSLLNLRQFHEKFISDTLNTTAKNWLTGSISDFCTIKSGSTVDKKFEVEAGDIAYLKVADMNIYENQNSIVTSSRFLKASDVRKTQIIEAGSIIFPKRGGAILTNKKRITDVPICADLNLMSVKSNGSIHPKLLFYYFQNVDMRRLGSGSSIPQINNYDIEPLKISFPKDPAEQSALVIKLDDVSQTITGLSKIYETKVAALSSLKSAILTQELQSEAA